MVQERDLGDTSLVVDSYSQGNLLGSEEAKGVMFEFQALMDSEMVGEVDLEVWGMEALPWLAD